MRAGVTELRNIRNAARKRHLANAYETLRTTGNYSSSKEARRRRRRRAASAEGASRTPSGGQVITASERLKE